MLLIIDRLTKTDRKDKQEYLFNGDCKYTVDNNTDPSKLHVQHEGRMMGFVVDDKYMVSIYAEKDERFPQITKQTSNHSY